ncbi:carbon-phosphorus lyase complex subunit PhnI [Synechococcus sp. OH20]|uniref:carbon-phosphorus lyase complex subunit PhnI n=1 Tax=Synechococcus sp. OH20 TaxID=139337 RepID=UPI0039C73AFB
MGYVVARGSQEAILNAEALFRELLPRGAGQSSKGLASYLPYLLDQVMAEAGLWAPELAAEALAQTGGDLYEALLLLRAHRTTLPRLGKAQLQKKEDLLLVRRLSSAFKSIPGGQVLGPTLDYSLRLLGFSGTQGVDPETTAAPQRYPSVRTWLKEQGLLEEDPVAEKDLEEEIPDLTRQPLLFPAPRAHRLQALARGDTGGLLALAYSAMRAYNVHTHPTVAELGVGYLEVRAIHPVRGGSFRLGRIRLAFAEVVGHGEKGYRLGFAASLGWNEGRVIAGAMLDLEMDRPTHPARSEEFVLVHTDPVEASGFALHYKLPHYVTFFSNWMSHQEAALEP